MHVTERTSIGATTTIPSIGISKYKNKILEYLNNLVRRVLPKTSNISQYHSIMDIRTLTKEDAKYLHTIWVNSIIEQLNKLTITIKKQPLLKEEYFDFLEIRQITEYIIKKEDYKEPSNKERDLIVKLLESFVKLISVKSDLFEDIDTEEEITDGIALKYEEKYELFNEEFSKYKEKFYIDMYTPSGKHVETINKLYAVMKG